MPIESTPDRVGLACSPENDITTFTSSSEDPNFPIENMLNQHPKRVYKAVNGVSSVTIQGDLLTTSSTLCIFNTNATEAIIRIVDNASLDTTIIQGDIFETGENNAVGIKFDPVPIGRHFGVDLTCPAGTTLQVGIFHIGVLVQTNNPLEGLNETQTDYSTTKVLSNGATYYKKRDIIRNFSFAVSEKFSEHTDNFILDISRNFGEIPMPWFITNISDNRWLIYGKLENLISASYKLCDNAELQFNIKEVL